jgi:hypothetical protein
LLTFKVSIVGLGWIPGQAPNDGIHSISGRINSFRDGITKPPRSRNAIEEPGCASASKVLLEPWR